MPFTTAQFLALFERYNAAVWPLQPVAIAAALALVVLLTVKPGRRVTDAAVSAVLAAFCAVVGVGYFWCGFARALSPAGWAFGTLFVAEAALLARAALRAGALPFAGAPRWRRAAGAAIAAYALVGYPVIGLLAGRAPAQSPWLGVVPCPTTIFTIGLLLLSPAPRLARYLAPLIVWALIGTTAALRFGIVEDLGMTAAALVAVTALAVGRTPAPARAPGA